MISTRAVRKSGYPSAWYVWVSNWIDSRVSNMSMHHTPHWSHQDRELYYLEMKPPCSVLCGEDIIYKLSWLPAAVVFPICFIPAEFHMETWKWTELRTQNVVKVAISDSLDYYIMQMESARIASPYGAAVGPENPEHIYKTQYNKISSPSGPPPKCVYSSNQNGLPLNYIFNRWL